MAPVAKGKSRDARSRHSTPLSTASTDAASTTATTAPAAWSFAEILDRHGRTTTTPSSDQLKKIKEALQAASDVSKSRSDVHDKGMRDYAKRKKEEADRVRDEQEQAEAEREEEERKEKLKRGRPKKEREEDRPLAVGAHSVARQDGVTSDEALSDPISPSAPVQGSSPTVARESSPSGSEASADQRQPRPAPTIPARQTFGPDPSTFDDPTVYHIREIHDDMTDEEKKDVFQVADYPHDDLYRLTCGTPPDRDLTDKKPQNQVTVAAFANYTEPYFKSFAEEDIAFLKERGDRSAPMIIPRRGPRSYKEIWAAEERAVYEESNADDPSTSTNQPLGSMEQMNEAATESSTISTGPMLARLLQTLRPERRPPPSENTTSSQVNGDANGMNGDSMMRDGTHDEHQSRPLPPATYLAENNQGPNKMPPSKMPWSEMDERVKAELRHIGFFSEDAEPDYDGHHDDEIAARLRYLQEQLQNVSILNGARKARVLELVEESAAQQEYSHITDDLDNQLNQAYLKRHRNIGKTKSKHKRPGGAGGGSHGNANGVGVSKPSIGEPIKALMERRRKWIDTIGPVVEYGKKEIPEESIFDEKNMKRLMAKEREMWSEAQDQS